MLSLHPSLEVVYRVVTPIPALGALSGDELLVRPSDPDFPIVLRRTFPLDVAPSIPDAAVRMLGAVPIEPSVGAPASTARSGTPPARARRLLRLA